ncbi:AAA family ATPase [Iningainema tapete]|uniref:AAA family ATPase n=1 Tax=Iningainema tapete BLCC-T55 TaxID=2748662 RepID=A0A8J6XP52_9CYAN|nr:ATP-binding protein [Iningainema tapete]MBD2778703.1 AAA family ATPase [Iningainema tapete BLCC-T55]
MLRSFTLKNFRCFQNFTLEPLERINLIAGKNNVGKTTLLEAILIFINPIPEALFQVNSVRGIFSKGRFEKLEELRELLFNQDVNKVIEIGGLEDNNQQSLKIRFAELEEAKILRRSLFDEIELLQAKESLTTKVRPHDTLVFEYQDDTTKKISHIALTVNGGTVGEYYRRENPVGIYLTTNTRSPKEDAVRFSRLALVKQQEEVLETLRLLEPRLQSLTVLVEREAMIYGDIGVSKLVPLPLMGEGMNRLLSIVLAIANAKGGTILIDEIENGLHHSVLTDVWKVIADAARRADVQIFATTHSYECIIAAHQAFESSEQYDFRYHRLERVDDEIQAITYDRENLATSEEFNWETR